MTHPVTIEQAKKMLSLADAGLCQGLGKPEPGKMCVEAAVCHALGLPHSDDPPCVGPLSRSFKIRLNDSEWSSNKARGEGLRDLMLAQLGTRDWPKEREWLGLMAEQVIRQIVPIALRVACKRASAEDAAKMEAAAVRCEKEGTREAALNARDAAADAAAYAAADAAAYAAAAAAAAYAAAAAATAKARDAVLCLMAKIAVDCYRKLDAPGIALLDEVAAMEAEEAK